MTQPTIENLEPLITSQETKGRSVSVTFRCPETGTEVPATANIQKAEGIAADATRKAKKGMWASMRRAVTRAIADACGNGTVGRVARDVANTAMAQKGQSIEFSKAEVQAAVVTAFESVQTKFRWNATTEAWNAFQEPTTPFAKRLNDAPVTEAFDQGVLARALVELSAADGDVSEEERAFIADFLTPEVGTVDDLLGRAPLTAAELEETSETARGSILMMAWACAMCDEDLAEAEQKRLDEFAAGMGMADEQITELRRDAQQFLFDQALTGVYAEGTRNDSAYAEAIEAASKMGIDQATAEKLDAGYRKRCGIV